MLRYIETRPGLVALYDIPPGNGAGQFLQPRSPHAGRLSLRVNEWIGFNILINRGVDPGGWGT